MEDHYKTFLRGTVAILVFGFLSQVVAYLTRFVFARQLSVQEFGLFYAVLSLMTFLTAIQVLGMDSAMVVYVTKYLAKKQFTRLKKLINILIGAKIVLSLIIITILLLFRNVLAEQFFKTPMALPLIYILSFNFLMVAFYSSFRSILRGYNKNLLFSFFDFLNNAIILVIASVLFMFYKNVYVPGLSYALASFLTVGVIFFVLIKTVPYFRVKSSLPASDKKKIISFSKSAFFHSMAGLILAQVDIMMLTYIKGLSDVAYYNAVLPVANLMLFFSGSLSFVLLTTGKDLLAREKNSALNELVSWLRKYIFILVWGLSVIVIVYAPEILRILFGSEYVVAYKGLMLYSLGIVFFASASINNQILYIFEKPQYAAKILVLVAVFNVLANIIMIPLFSMVGAVITTVVGFALMFLLSEYYSRKLLTQASNWRVLLRGLPIFSAAAGYAAISYILRLFLGPGYLNAAFGLVASLCIYIVLLYLLKVMSISEMRSLLGMLKSVMRSK
ncbi:MAG: flippase [Candidatus Woesearchaeota archaeon]